MYGNFAGRDASRGMAKQSFDMGIYLLSYKSISYFYILEMLTPIDQPLDNLEDLSKADMYVII